MTDDVPPAFAAFMAARYDALARSAYLLLGDRGHAEDLVQAALLKTYRAWDSLRAAQAAEAFTRTTMVRLAGRQARRRWRGEIPSDDFGADSAWITDDHQHRVPATLDVRRALRSLPLTQRAVLVLRYFDDLSEAQTAAVLGCSVGTVKSRANRGLARLRAEGLLTEHLDVDAVTEARDG
ncbi:MAG: polymerase sigma-E factor [Frankiales bacterium]|nr:polymerase sigma-E factor [Frankiales bacterium]